MQGGNLPVAAFDWIEHILTALIGAAAAVVGLLLKARAENRAKHAEAGKTESEAGTQIVNQASAVVDMWQEIVKDLRARVESLELAGKEKDGLIRSLTGRVEELERENASLRVELDSYKQPTVKRKP